MQTLPASQPSGLRIVVPMILVLGMSIVLAVGSHRFGPMAVLPIFGILFFGLVVMRPDIQDFMA